MGQFDGKTAVVTGGSTGIGLATAERLAAEGAHVFVTGRREAELGKAVARGLPGVARRRHLRAEAESRGALAARGSGPPGREHVLHCFCHRLLQQRAVCDSPDTEAGEPVQVMLEQQTGAVLQELVDEGLIRHVGVSNFSVEQMAELARARPLDVVQAPYGMLRRQIEADVLPYCVEHEIGLFVYAPLAYGMLTGTMTADQSFPAGDWRGSSAEFRGDTLARNLAVVDDLARFAAEHGCTVSQLAIAWSLVDATVDAAIVGTRSAKHISEAIDAASIHLSAEDMAEIDAILDNAISVTGPTPESLD